MEFLQMLHVGVVAGLVATIVWMAAQIGGAVRRNRYQPTQPRFR